MVDQANADLSGQQQQQGNGGGGGKEPQNPAPQPVGGVEQTPSQNVPKTQAEQDNQNNPQWQPGGVSPPQPQTSGDPAGGQQADPNLNTPTPQEAGQGQEQGQEAPPDWLPEGFKTQAEFESWLNEKGYTKQAQTKTPPDPNAKPPQEEGQTEEQETPNKPIDQQEGFAEDQQKLSEEVAQKGTLSDESAKEFAEKYGLSTELVKSYAEGQAARLQQQHAELYQTVGGQEAYSQVINWAQQNAKEAHDAYFNSTNMEQAKLALAGLHQMYVTKNGQPPEKLTQGSAGVPADGFNSVDEYISAINSPQYDRDPNYRQEVHAKAARSNIFTG